MTVEAVLHVVTSPDSGLLAALEQHLGAHARVCQYATLPPARTFGSADLVVIDLDGVAETPDARQVLPLLSRLEMWFVGGRQQQPAHWLDAARWPNARVVHTDAGDPAAGLGALTKALRQRLVGPSAGEIAALVLAREPGLRGVEGLVRAVCERTWEVRHPKQLAAVLGTRPSEVKEPLREMGFSRVEHFITYVRWVAFEQLVAVHRLRLPLAQKLAGVTDPSNLRRQMERARRGSARALKRLKAG